MSHDARKEARIVFLPSGKRGRFALGTPLLDAARALGVDLDSVCGGRAICGRCQVEVAEGEHAKLGIQSHESNVTAPGDSERRFAERHRMPEKRRLSCQARLQSDVVIDVPATSQVHRQVVRKPHEDHDISIDPVVRAYFVRVAPPDMHDAMGDLERLGQALADDWQLEDLSYEPSVLRSLQNVLSAADREVTVAVRNGNRVIAVWPGYKSRLFGIAVDIGSTTVAGHLCDLATGDVIASAGCMNPQIRFGEDLMSRVSYVMLNPGSETELTKSVRGAVDGIVESMSADAGIARDDVIEMTVVGNPVMHHLMLGISPVGLGTAPFALATDSSVEQLASMLDIRINPGGYVYVLPCIAGHVGADAAGVLLAEAPYDRDDVSLIVDVGTNAEILLGNRERLLSASSPTGPAFEGAQISAGQRAAPGAIERVRIDRDTLEPRFRVIGSELWSDDPAFADQVGKVTGICGSGIIEVLVELYSCGVIDADGRIAGEAISRTARIVEDGRTFAYQLHRGEPEIRITQNDVRAIQLAKAALYAGARLLMDRLGVERVDRIRLAGAFGAHIDVGYATKLGLIPECDPKQVSSAGNAAGTGARIALLNRASRALIEQQVRSVEKIETAVEPSFQDHFVASMGFPGGTPDKAARRRSRRGRRRA